MALRRLNFSRTHLTVIAVVAMVLSMLSAMALVSVIEDAQGRFARHATLLFGLVLLGVIAMMGLIGMQLGRLVRERREQVAGSALASRLTRNFAWIALPPIVLVFLFALNFLARSVDQWFDVRTDVAMQDALQVGRELLQSKRDVMQRQFAQVVLELDASDDAQVILEQAIDRGDFDQLALFGETGNVLATAARDPRWLFPVAPDADLVLKVQASGVDVATLPIANDAAATSTQSDGLALRMLQYRVGARDGGVLLQAMQMLPPDLGARTRNIEASYNDYQRLKFLRGALKTSFIMVLAMVVLLALLTAILAALAAAQRLSQPIANLADATSEVARGNLEVTVHSDSHDELSQLAASFNQMTRELNAARIREREAQQLIESNRAYLATVLQQITSGVVSLDLQASMVTANDAACRLLGIQSQTADALTQAVERNPAFASLVQLLVSRAREQRSAWLEEVLVQHPDRAPQVFLVRGDNLPNHAGMVAIFDDMTVVAQAQREAAWSEVAKRLAHEIKNPLTPIQLAAERMQYKLSDKLSGTDKELLDKGARTIVAQVDTLKNLVNAFGDYAISPRLRFQSLDLHHQINECLDLFDSDPRAHIERQLQASPSLARIDPDRIRQLLNNLLKNALEAAPDRAQVQIMVRTRLLDDGRFIEMAIGDDGPGLPKDFDATWFEPYRTNKPKGTGLGLSIVQKIAEEHGGRVRGENRAEGGARFVLSLPLQASSATKADG